MIIKPTPDIYSFEELNTSQGKKILNHQLPDISKNASLLFRDDANRIYVIESLEDMVSIQEQIENNTLTGDWGISTDRIFKNESESASVSITELPNITTRLIAPEKISSQSLTELIKIITRRALPIGGNQLIDMSGSLITSWILARINPETLAAGVFVNVSQLLTVAVVGSTFNAIAALVPKADKSNQKDEIGIIMQNSWLLGAITSIPQMVFLANIDQILIGLGQPDQLAKIAQSYFSPYIWSIPASMWLYADIQFVYAIKKSHIAVGVNIVGTVIASAASYILANGKLGAPTLNASGVGLGWSIQSWISLLLFKLALFYYRKDLSEYGLLRFHHHNKWPILSQLLRIGTPIMAQTLGDLFSFFVTALMVGRLGITALSSFEVLSQYLLLVAIPITALSLSTCLLVNDAYGLQDYALMKKYSYLSMGLATGLMSGVFIIFAALPKQLAAVYLDVDNPNNAEVLTYLKYLFLLVGAGQIINGVREVASNSLRGLQDTTIPMLYRLLTTWGVAIPLGYVASFPLRTGIYGLTTVSDISTLICAGMLAWRWWNKSEALANPKVENNESSQNYLFNSCKKTISSCTTFFNNHLGRHGYRAVDNSDASTTNTNTKTWGSYFSSVGNRFFNRNVEEISQSAIAKI